MKYEIRIQAQGPERTAQTVIDEFEQALGDLHLEPHMLMLERQAEAEGAETQAQVIVTNQTLLAVAKVLDGVMAQKCDPESDLWDPKFTGYDLPFSMVDLVERMMEDQLAAEQGK